MKITVKCEHLTRTVEEEDGISAEYLGRRVHAVVMGCPGCAYTWSPQLVVADSEQS